MARCGIVENYPLIDANELNRLGVFGNATTAFPYVGLRLSGVSSLRTNCRSIEIQFATDRRWQSIPVRWTRCNFGGKRPWLECLCGRRVVKLYHSGWCFGCRTCQGLIYECQRRGPRINRYLQVRKLRARCGGSPSILEPFPDRPPRMHRKTYSRLRSRAEILELQLRNSPRFMKRVQYYAQTTQYPPFSR